MEAGSGAHGGLDLLDAPPDSFLYALGLAVQLIRRVYALSRDEVARRAQLAIGDVLAIEQGVEGDVPLSVVFRIADGLGIRASGLLRIVELILIIAHEAPANGAVDAPHQ